MIYAFLLLLSAVADPLTGNWKVTGDVSGNPLEAVCHVVQSGAALTGQCTAREVPSKLTGEVDGSKVSWHYTVEHESQTYTLIYSGKLTPAGQIEGSIDVKEAGVSGTFVAKKD